jgi:hypothetical protein
MVMQRLNITALALAGLLGACSDTSKPQDLRVVDRRAPDRSADDLAVDQASPDVSLVDRRLGEQSAGKDARTEKQPGDLPKKDSQSPDFGPAAIYGTITRTVSPVGDGLGDGCGEWLGDVLGDVAAIGVVACFPDVP